MRKKNWKTKTTYEDRINDIKIHDLIIESLDKHPQAEKASIEDDYKGIDVWLFSLPFDIKITDGIPRTYHHKDEGLILFKWLLENQDLDRFHDTNRIIIITHQNKTQLNKKDSEKISNYILHTPQENIYKNIEYNLKGRPEQNKHRHYGTNHVMAMGVLIHYTPVPTRSYSCVDWGHCRNYNACKGTCGNE